MLFEGLRNYYRKNQSFSLRRFIFPFIAPRVMLHGVVLNRVMVPGGKPSRCAYLCRQPFYYDV